MFFHVEGSQAARRLLHLGFGKVLHLSPPRGPGQVLQIADACKHVGTHMVAASSMLPEIKVRMASMLQALWPLRKKLFCRTDTPKNTRVLIARAFLFSKGTFQSATWPSLQSREAVAFHSPIMGVFRDIALGSHKSLNHSITDDEILQSLEVLAPLSMLKLVRINFFARVITKVSPRLLKLLYVARSAPRSWLSSVQADLNFLCAHDNRFGEWSSAPMSKWVGLFQNNPARALRAVEATLGSESANSRQAWATTRKLAQLGQAFPCEACGQNFSTKQQLATHIYRQHGVKHPARYLVDGTSCPICLLEFHTRTRLIAHIANKSTVCFSNLKCRMQPLSEAVIAQMDDEAKVCEKANKRSGWRRGRAHEPCIRLSGPLWPIIPIAEN